MAANHTNENDNMSSDTNDDNEEPIDEQETATRRNMLKAGGVLGIGALLGGSSTYAATGTAEAATGSVGTSSNPVDVYADNADVNTLTGSVTGGASLTDIAGTNLSINNGTLDAASGGGVDVEDAGSTVVSGATAIDMATNLSVTDDGDGTVTVDASGGSSGGKPYATVVVASSEAENTSGADYVCDGTDDQNEIESAIADIAASNRGGRVLLTEGRYTLSAGISDQSADNVVVEGQGDGAELFLEAGVSANIFDVTAQESWAFHNLELDGNGANQSDAGSSSNQCGIYFGSGSSDLTVSNCYIHDTGYANVRVNRSSTTQHTVNIVNNVLDGTYFTNDVAANGVALAGGGSNEAWNAVVANNIVRNQVWAGVEIAEGWYNVTVAGNVFKDTSSGGQAAINPHPKTSIGEVAVTGNTIVCPNAKDGISSDYASNVSITNNVIKGVTRHGIHAGFGGGEIPIMNGNRILDCGDNGIRVYGDGGSSNDGVIVANKISNSTNEGILLDSSTSNNLVMANRVKGSGTTNDIVDNGSNTVNNNVTG